MGYVAHVEAYCSKDLSFESDALPAITGILNAISQRYYSKMIWALPESILDLALLWKASSRHIGARGRRRPNVPSWSWVSWSAEVTYDCEIDTGYPTLEDRVRPVNEYWCQGVDPHRTKIIQKMSFEDDYNHSDNHNNVSVDSQDGKEKAMKSDSNSLDFVSSDYQAVVSPASPLTPFLYFEAESARFTMQPMAINYSQFCIAPDISATTAADEGFEPDVGETVWLDDPWDSEIDPTNETIPQRERFIGKK